MKLLSLFLLFAIPTSIHSQALTQEWTIKPAWAELYSVKTYVGSQHYDYNHILTLTKGVYAAEYLDYFRISLINTDEGTNSNIFFNNIDNEDVGFTPLSFDVSTSGNVYISTKKLSRTDTREYTASFTLLKFNIDQQDTLWSYDFPVEYDRHNKSLTIGLNDHVITSHGRHIFTLNSDGILLKSDSLYSEILQLYSFSDSTFSTINRTPENNLNYTERIARGGEVIKSIDLPSTNEIRAISTDERNIAFLFNNNSIAVLNTETNQYISVNDGSEENVSFNTLTIRGKRIHLVGTSKKEVDDNEIHMPIYIEMKIEDASLMGVRQINYSPDKNIDFYPHKIISDVNNNVLIAAVDRSEIRFPDYYFLLISDDDIIYDLELDGGSDISSYYTIDFYDSFLTQNNAFITVNEHYQSIGNYDISYLTFKKLSCDILNSIDDDEQNIVSNIHLKQNYPNPFNPSTNISIKLPKAQGIELSIYTIHGKLIKTIAQGFHNSGEHKFSIDLSEYASGVYMYQLKGNDFLETKKMTLIK